MKNKIAILFAILVFIVGLGQLASADTEPTCTILVPSSNTAYNGTVVFNATITSNGTGIFNVTGINFTVSSTVVGSSTLDGVNLTNYNATVSTSSITDVYRTTVTANIIINYTTAYGSCTSTNVDFDNTNPVCSQTVDREIIEALEPLTVDCSGSTDTTDKTYSIVLTRDDTSTKTKTPSDGVAIFDSDDTSVLGEATAVCTVTDEVSKTNACTSNTITITGKDGEGTIITPPSDKEKDSDILPVLIVIGLAVVLILIVVLVLMKSGKKKRR